MEPAMPVFAPRSPRAYVPDADQPPYRETRAPVSTRPSARWLPDPEPDAGDARASAAGGFEPAPPRHRASAPAEPARFERGAPGVSGHGDAQISRQEPVGQGHCDALYEEDHDGPPYDDHGDAGPDGLESVFPGESAGLGVPPLNIRGLPVGDDPVASLYDNDDTPPGRRIDAAPIGYAPEPEASLPPDPPQAAPVAAPEPAEPDFWESSRLLPGEDSTLPPEFPNPLRSSASGGQATPGAVPGDAPQGDGAPLPTEATAGNESVRDIWARLQAMGGKESASPRQDKAPAQDQPRREPPPGGESVAPWEQLEYYGVVPAFLGTLKNILLKPGDFFVGLPTSGGMVRPLLFAMVVCEVAALSCLVWNFFGMGPNFAELGRTEWFQGLGSGGLGGVALLGLAPVLLVLFALLDSALAHLLLGLLRGASRPFADTFRTVCYAGGPWILVALPMPFSYLIPVVLIWHMTLQAIGLKKLHQAGYPQVLAAVLVKWSLFFMGSFAVLHMLFTHR